MRRKPKSEQTYHCDGYYYREVCPSRGLQDPADIRYDKDGFTRQTRYECKTYGLSPFTSPMSLCQHCVEMRKYFRRQRSH